MKRCVSIRSVVYLACCCTAQAVAQQSAPTNAWVYAIAEKYAIFLQEHGLLP